MKPRTLFDADAWVRREFKPQPLPETPVVSMRDRGAKKVAPKAKPFPPSNSSAEKALKAKSSPAVREMIRIVSTISGVPAERICGHSRNWAIKDVRWTAVWLSRIFTDRSLPAIASEFGGRHHTSILHAVRKVNETIAAAGIEAESETPEAWSSALLGYYQKLRARQARELRERQRISGRATYHKYKLMPGKTLRGPRTSH
jgi:hypothetical protein